MQIPIRIKNNPQENSTIAYLLYLFGEFIETFNKTSSKLVKLT